MRNERRSMLLLAGALAGFPLALSTGCAVGQRPGNGLTLFQREPNTNAGYWLYLPEDYVQTPNTLVTNRHWPLVITFHGMKPFDNDHRQIRQWQQEADRYGFVVCAPQLKTPDLMYEFPFRHITPALQRDEECTIAILDHLTATTDIDPNAVLSTSWSSGGYLAHYMANRHPRRFSCVGVYQSNFSADILDTNKVPEYRDHKIAVFFTENDFKVCREESKQAALWYARHGFDLTFAMLDSLGHERTPSVAAAFFAKTCGAKAKTPPTELARMQVREVPIESIGPATLAMSSSTERSSVPFAPTPTPVDADGTRDTSPFVTSAPPAYWNIDARPLERSPAARSQSDFDPVPRPAPAIEPPGERRIESRRPLRTTPVPQQPERTRSAEHPARPAAERTVSPSPVRVRLSSTIGVAPLLVSYSAVVPSSMRRGAYFLWTVNGDPVSNGINGQKYLITPGDHRIEVVVTTADGEEHRTGQSVTVLEPNTGRGSGQ